jgi:Sulfotransferase domain
MLPNLVVIGAQKCGTSALHYYLNLHPEIAMSRPKELNFFIKKRNWDLGLEWYESHFEEDRKVRGEASPNYTNFPRFRGVAKKMHRVLPEAKLIYLVRDPIDRMVSAFLHNQRKGRVDGSLADVITEPGATYLRRSRYHKQVKRFARLYPSSSLMIVDQVDLLERRHETLSEVFRFLGVDDSFWTPRYGRLRHETARPPDPVLVRVGERVSPSLTRRVAARASGSGSASRPLVDEDLHEELAAKLKPDTDRFREFTGRDFAHWSI